MSNYLDRIAAKLGPQIAPGANIHETCRIEMGAEISAQAVLASGVHIGRFVKLAGQVTICPSVTVHPYTTLVGPLFIGEGSIIGPGVIIGLNQADTESRHTRLMDACRIGRAAQILAGLQVGPQARIRAFSVVTGDVPPYAIAASNPAHLEGYACLLCGGLLSQVQENEDVVEACCTTCGAEGYRFPQRAWTAAFNRVLLPHHRFGAPGTLLHTPRGWRDQDEIEVGE